MTITDDITTNGADYVKRATRTAGAVAAQTTKTATEATVKATKSAVDNAALALDVATKSAKALSESQAEAGAVATKAVNEATQRALGAWSLGEYDYETGAALDAAQVKAQELVDAFTAQVKQAGNFWLDAYAQGFATVIDTRRSFAESVKVPAAADIINAGTKALEDLNGIYVTAARELLK